MIHPLTNVIGKKLEKEGLKYSIREAGEGDNGFSYVEAGISGKASTFLIRFISEDEKDVKIITNEFVKYPMDKLGEAYEYFNSINQKYKFIKFCVDPNDGAVSMQYDLPISLDEDNVSEASFEMLIRFMQILDDVYPELMKKIYA